MQVAKVPHPVFRLSYEQKDISSDVTPYVRSVTYTDYLQGQSDELEVELEDADGRWIGAWYPGMGDKLTLRIGYDGEPLLPCGSFEIDEIGFGGAPSIVTIRGLATGVTVPVRTKEHKPYENTTLAAIAQRIAKRHKLQLVGTIKEIRIDRATQFKERDVEFLTRLAREYGYAFKITGRKLVFSELAALREREAVTELAYTDLARFDFRDKIKDVYDAVSAKRHDPKSKKLISYYMKADGSVGERPSSGSGTSGRATSQDTLKVNNRAGSKATLQAQAKAALETSNLQKTTGSITTFGNPKLVAGNTVALSGLGKLSGKYLIESARHRIERKSGYSSELELKRVAPAEAAAPAKKGASK